MRLTRSFVAQPLASGATFALPEDAAATWCGCCACRPAMPACCSMAMAMTTMPALFQSASARCWWKSSPPARIDNESPLAITLVQGIARGEKMDWILQKATELGVTRFLPATSDRSEVKLDAQRADKRVAHWREVVVSACEQSGRARVPEVATPQPLAQAAGLRPGRGFLLDPLADQTLAALRGSDLDACTLAIGPEGGWSPRDREQLLAAGFEGLRLGPRILRTETAGIAAIAALQAMAGDLG